MQEQSPPVKSAKRWIAYMPWVVFSLIVIGAAGLRLYNIQYITHVDEPNIIKRAAAFADGQWHIKWYNWPAQSLIRLDGVVFKAAHGIQQLRQVHEPITVMEQYQITPIFFKVIARCVSIFFAMLTLFFVFQILSLVRSRWVGVLGSAMLAVGYLHTLHSRFATPDVPMTAALMANIWIAIVLMQNRTLTKKKRLLLYTIAGAVFGFAFATKYTGLIVAVPLVYAHLWVYGSDHHWKPRVLVRNCLTLFTLPVLVAIIAFIVTHTAFNPFAIQDRHQIMQNVLFESSNNRLGADWGGRGNAFQRNFSYYFWALLSWNGSVVTIVGYATMLFALIRIRRKEYSWMSVISFCFVLTLLGLSVLTLHWSRWAVPFTPLIAVASAVGFADLYRWFSGRWNPQRRWIAAVFGIIYVLMLAPQLLLNIVQGYYYHLPTTTDRMITAIQKQVPPGAVIVADTYTLSSGKEYQITQPRVKMYKTLPRQMKEQGVTHVVVKPSRFAYAKKQPDRYHETIAFFEELNTTATLLANIGPTADPILSHKRDWGVYRWLWEHRHRPADLWQTKSSSLRLKLYAL